MNARSLALTVVAVTLSWLVPHSAGAQHAGCIVDPDVHWPRACSGGQAHERSVELFLYLDSSPQEARLVKVFVATPDFSITERDLVGRQPPCLLTALDDSPPEGVVELVVRLEWVTPDRHDITVAYGVVRVGAWGSPDDEPGGFVLNDPDAPCVLRPYAEAAVAAASAPTWFQHVSDRLERAIEVHDVESARDQRRQHRGRVDNDRRGARATDGDPADVLVAQP